MDILIATSNPNKVERIKRLPDLTEQELIYQDRFAQKILNDLIKKIL